MDVAKRVIDDDQKTLFKQPNAWTTFLLRPWTTRELTYP